jgi:CheY-like chemotaxis protein
MKKLVLVIEDDEAIRNVTKLLLELEGFDVACANNGQEGLDFLGTANIPPNLILLDLMMPVKDGFEFRNEQLNNLNFASIPVIVLTAEGGRSERKKNLKAAAILTKPFEIDSLISAVKQHCA